MRIRNSLRSRSVLVDSREQQSEREIAAFESLGSSSSQRRVGNGKPFAAAETVSCADEAFVSRIVSRLDDLTARLEDHDPSSTPVVMDELFRFLFQIRRELPVAEWKRVALATIVPHPIRRLLHADPFTRRAFEKPRGYAGDAGVIDFMYRRSSSSIPTRHYLMHEYLMALPAARAIRFRRQLVSEMVDATAAIKARPRIMSFASGHCRELDLSAAARTGTIGAMLAVDQDSESLETVTSDYGKLGVESRQGSVRQLISGKLKTEPLDFAYALGLMDYLSAAVGQRFCRSLFDLLAPGGEMMFANFLPDIPDSGYMESFMNWDLIYRTPDQALQLLSEIPRYRIDSTSISFDPSDNLVFVHCRKKGGRHGDQHDRKDGNTLKATR